jgi:hypothetical protein
VVLKVGTVPKPEKPAEDTQEKVEHAAVPVEGAGAQADGDSMSKKNNGGGGRYVLDYSAKSVAVFGDTKPIKDTLKARGGRFNKALWDSTSGQLSAGWVLAIKEKEGLLADAALGVVLKVGTVPKPEKPAEDTQEKVEHAAGRDVDAEEAPLRKQARLC